MVLPNVRLATKMGQNGALWAFISVILYFVFQVLFGSIFILSLYKGPLDPIAIQNYMKTLPVEKPLASLAILLFGVGGILLARYILERIGKNNKKLS